MYFRLQACLTLNCLAPDSNAHINSLAIKAIDFPWLATKASLISHSKISKKFSLFYIISFLNFGLKRSPLCIQVFYQFIDLFLTYSIPTIKQPNIIKTKIGLWRCIIVHIFIVFVKKNNGPKKCSSTILTEIPRHLS